MKQTIDEAYKVIDSYNNGFTGCAGNLQDSLDVAMDIMRKYQKIEQIVKDYHIPTNSMTIFQALDMISELLKDGNDDYYPCTTCIYASTYECHKEECWENNYKCREVEDDNDN